jgi:hypothetical protein
MACPSRSHRDQYGAWAMSPRLVCSVQARLRRDERHRASGLLLRDFVHVWRLASKPRSCRTSRVGRLDSSTTNAPRSDFPELSPRLPIVQATERALLFDGISQRQYLNFSSSRRASQGHRHRHGSGGWSQGSSSRPLAHTHNPLPLPVVPNQPIKDPILSKISLLPPLSHIISNSLSLAIPQILHLVLRHQAPLHATVQVPFAQLSALGRVDPAGSFQASQVLFHQGLAFGVVVEREGAFRGWIGAPDFDAGAGGAEGGHFGLVCVAEWGLRESGGSILLAGMILRLWLGCVFAVFEMETEMETSREHLNSFTGWPVLQRICSVTCHRARLVLQSSDGRACSPRLMIY